MGWIEVYPALLSRTGPEAEPAGFEVAIHSTLILGEEKTLQLHHQLARVSAPALSSTCGISDLVLLSTLRWIA
jgi:hypothetical protein